eukprot:m.831670 g.831670  ORF g.831670 m.831670 type:complete len:265 (+) comp23430_c0_seq50:1602-2396(+)
MCMCAWWPSSSPAAPIPGASGSTWVSARPRRSRICSPAPVWRHSTSGRAATSLCVSACKSGLSHPHRVHDQIPRQASVLKLSSLRQGCLDVCVVDLVTRCACSCRSSAGINGAAQRNTWCALQVNLLVFITVKFFLVPLAVSLPIPAGVFVPVFVLGAGFGRLVGEVMADTIKDGTCTVGGVRVQPVPCVGFAAGTRLRHCPLQITLAPSTTRRARLTDPWALFQAGIVAYMWGFENMHTVVRRVQCRPQGTLCRAPCAGDRDD